jgi:diketogulonate reductase-like aldo/keto reductase
MSSKVATLPLLDGMKIPIFGLGVFQAQANGETEKAVSLALKHGYRHVDTAALYRNEHEVGAAIKKSGIPREEIYVTTKLWNSSRGREATVAAFTESLKKLDLEYIDLYLIHSPLGGKIVETWDAIVELKKKGLIKSIGVSNFNVHHLEALRKARPDDIPVVNQIEVSPFLTRDDLVKYCQKAGIAVEAYSPLTKGQKLSDPKLMEIAAKYNKSVAQVLIRWSLQRGFVCIPKSVKEERIRENGDVFDFNISEDDMKAMNGMNENLITGWDPLDAPWED